MKKKWLVFGLICAGILTVLAVNKGLVGSGGSASKVYGDLAKFQITDVSRLKGNYFILHFWAKWCEPCAEEIPELVEFAKNAKFSKPLIVLAVSLDKTLEESKQILPGKGADLPPNFILALDASQKYAEAMGSYQYPETYFVSPSGEILEKWIGPQKWNKPEVLNYFTQRLQ